MGHGLTELSDITGLLLVATGVQVEIFQGANRHNAAYCISPALFSKFSFPSSARKALALTP